MSIQTRLDMLEAEGYEPAHYQGKYYDMGWLNQEDTFIFWTCVGASAEYDCEEKLLEVIKEEEEKGILTKWYNRIKEESENTCGSFEEELKKAFQSILYNYGGLDEIDPYEIKQLEVREFRKQLENDLDDFLREDIDLIDDKELGGWLNLIS